MGELMALYARVENDQVLERRELSSIPPHKASLWRPIVIEGSGPQEQVIVEANRVRLVRTERALSVVKAELIARLDGDAERVRLKYVTPGAAMAMTYQEKHAQARAVRSLGEVAANALTDAERIDQFPTLSASVGIEAPTLWGCAQLVIQRYETFADLSRVIELTRLQGKKAISDASDVAAAKAAYEAITWTV